MIIMMINPKKKRKKNKTIDQSIQSFDLITNFSHSLTIELIEQRSLINLDDTEMKFEKNQWLPELRYLK